jgi:hypothetical protein
MRELTMGALHFHTAWIGALHMRTGHIQERLVKRPKVRALSKPKPHPSGFLAAAGLNRGHLRISNHSNNLRNANRLRETGRRANSPAPPLPEESESGTLWGHAHSGHAPFLWCFVSNVGQLFCLSVYPKCRRMLKVSALFSEH